MVVVAHLPPERRIEVTVVHSLLSWWLLGIGSVKEVAAVHRTALGVGEQEPARAPATPCRVWMLTQPLPVADSGSNHSHSPSCCWTAPAAPPDARGLL